MEKELSCIHSRAVIECVRDRRGSDLGRLLLNLHPEIDALPNPEAFLKNPCNWISGEIAAALFQRARVLLEDDRAAFRIARYLVRAASPGLLGRFFVKPFGSTGAAIRRARKLAGRWNRNNTAELVRMENGRAVIRIHWKTGRHGTKDFCMMAQGLYTGVPGAWGCSEPSLSEHCCRFEGGPFCEYHFRWPIRDRFRKVGTRFFTPKSALVDTLCAMEKDKELIQKKVEEVQRINLALSRKVRQLTAVQETGKAILSVLELEKLLSVIMNLLRNVCRLQRGLIMLINTEKNCLETIYGTALEDDIPDALRSYTVPLDQIGNILARVATTGKPEYVVGDKPSPLRTDEHALQQAEPSSVYVTPLITHSKVIGVIAIDGSEGRGVPSDTWEALEVFAPQIAIGIENARLYSRLREKMDHLRRSQALLSRAERFSSLGNLAARLAHEIKNPMTAIAAFIQMLPRKFDDERFRTEFYEVARDETERVNCLITEMLDLVKTRENHFSRENLHQLIDRMVLLVSPQSRAKQIRIDQDYSPEIGKVWMDPEKMKEVILNLLTNAVEFTDRAGKIRIVTRRLSDNGHPGGVRIDLVDNGIGIEADRMEQIFNPYFSTKPESRANSGTGLGLFVSHQNVHDQGGSIEVESSVGRGTRFVVTLPDHPPAAGCDTGTGALAP